MPKLTKVENVYRLRYVRANKTIYSNPMPRRTKTDKFDLNHKPTQQAKDENSMA